MVINHLLNGMILQVRYTPQLASVRQFGAFVVWWTDAGEISHLGWLRFLIRSFVPLWNGQEDKHIWSKDERIICTLDPGG